jgi:adenylate cyclase
MTRGLRERDRIRRTFERYVSREVASEILRHPELAPQVGVKRELTVCFVDVAGFTTLAEQLAPEAVVARLNEYFDAVCGAVLAQDGTVNEFLGDGVVAFWGAPVPQADHALRACRAALAAREALGRLAVRWRAEGLPSPRFRIGLHTGALVVGELGASERRAYRAVGDAMNVAARIEGVNKLYRTELLISETTRAAAGAALAAREIDRVRVVGRIQPLALFEPVVEGAPDAQQRALLDRYAAALAAYRARDFAAAAGGFAACLALAPGDGPSAVLLERARAFAQHPPPSDWDAVHVLASK